MTRRTLLACFIVGFIVRLGILWQTQEMGIHIADEDHYVQLAESLATGKGFAWRTGELTSLRPPAYPVLVAAVWGVTGTGHLQAVRGVQCVLSLLTAVAALHLGRQLFNVRVGRLAAAITWLYPSLIFLDFTILTETLFTLLLVTFVYLAVRSVQAPRAVTALGCGLALGLGALTRSVLYPLPLVLCPLLAVVLVWPPRPSRPSFGAIGARLRMPGVLRSAIVVPALVFVGYALVIVPWAVRNTRLQHVTTIVDTMGGMNLRMGNYEYTPEDRIWDAVSLTGEKNWVYALTQEPAGPPPPGGVFTEGMKDKWAQRKAIEYMRTHPGITLRRALIKFGDFWGLERSFAAGVQQGLYHPPLWFAAAAIAAMLASYVAVVILGTWGLWLGRPDWRIGVLALLPIVVITAAHSVVFGHERYHVPLIPLLAIAAAAFWSGGVRESLRRHPLAASGAALTTIALVAGWVRQLVLIDGDKIRRLLDGLW